MKFLDRVKLLVRATVGGALGGGSITRTHGGRSDRLRDEAQAQLEALRQNLAEAERRSDEALATRLRQEIAELQRLLDNLEAARRRVAQSPPLVASQPVSAPTEKRQAAPDVSPSSDAQLDETRIADYIRKLRDRRGE